MHLEIYVYWSHLYCRHVIAFPKANIAVDPHQTVPRGAVRFGSTLFATEDVLQTDIRCELLIRAHTVCYNACYKYGLWAVHVREMQLMLTSMANISVQPNIVDPDQTAPSEAVRYGSTLIVTKRSFNNELGDDIWVLSKGNATYAYVNG